jgi:hypothetical protein
MSQWWLVQAVLPYVNQTSMKTSMKTSLLTAIVLTAGSLHAGTLAESTFDSGVEGWEVGDLFNSTGSVTPNWSSTGGNPDGFIHTGDFFGLNAFQAPKAFIGDQSAAYGGSVHLDAKLLARGENRLDGPFPVVVIGDGSTMLQFIEAGPNINGWKSYDIPLVASAGWRVNLDGELHLTPGPEATEEQLKSVLGNLQFLNIFADWYAMDDAAAIDNVRLSGVESTNTVPDGGSSLALLGLGMIGLAGVRRFVRR